MKLLGIECSAGPVSAAVTQDGHLLSQCFSNIKLTHSQTLLPMAVQALENSRTQLRDIDCIAVAAGPGSFTGIRIGISAVKGMAAPLGLPCAPVSTLRAIAEGFRGTQCVVCAVMDARCNQVYNALFEVKGGAVHRLCEDRALMCSELAEELVTYASNPARPIVIAGDGTELFYPFTAGLGQVRRAPEPLRFQNAAGVCLAAEELLERGATVTPERLLPVYLRLPQAERELKKKETERKSL